MGKVSRNMKRNKKRIKRSKGKKKSKAPKSRLAFKNKQTNKKVPFWQRRKNNNLGCKVSETENLLSVNKAYTAIRDDESASVFSCSDSESFGSSGMPNFNPEMHVGGTDLAFCDDSESFGSSGFPAGPVACDGSDFGPDRQNMAGKTPTGTKCAVCGCF